MRTFYRTEMRLWGPDQPSVPVVWHRAEDTAKTIPFAHAWTSVDFLAEKGDRGPFGLLGSRGRYSDGTPPAFYSGRAVHGPRSAWEEFGVVGTDPELITLENGVLPGCAPPVQIMRGGFALGGRTPQGTGMLSRGGFTIGGRSYMGTGPILISTGGFAMGGKTLQGTGDLQESKGGFAIGGQTPQGTGDLQISAGGFAIGGTSPQGSGSVQRSQGGFAIGGPSPQGVGDWQKSQGGFAIGGPSPQGVEPAMKSAGGFAFGGASPMLAGLGRIGSSTATGLSTGSISFSTSEEPPATGDTLVWIRSYPPAAITPPFGYTLVEEGTNGDPAWGYYLFAVGAIGGGGTPTFVSADPLAALTGILLQVRDVYLITDQDEVFDFSAVPFGNAVDVANPRSSVVQFYAFDESGFGWVGDAGTMAKIQPGGTSGNVWCFAKAIAPTGTFFPQTMTLSSEISWASVTVVLKMYEEGD